MRNQYNKPKEILMIYYLFTLALCISTIAFCAEHSSATQSWPREQSNSNNIDPKQKQQEDIISILQMKNGYKMIISDKQYCLKNHHGSIWEKRIHPITCQREERNFTFNDIAEFSFDHPKLPVNIVLKK